MTLVLNSTSAGESVRLQRLARTGLTSIAGALMLTLAPLRLDAAGPRALAPGELPADARLAAPKDLDGYFPFLPASSRSSWDERARQLQLQMRVALGLWPAPPKTPLNPVIHGRIDREDYTVEKVYFESIPGFFVTGNLYRPKGKSGPLPAVLSPHGHWPNGRFMDYGVERVRQEIVQGAERFEEGGRSPLQARCVQLARMGCVVFHYDMIGYADSIQLSMALAHGFAKQRPEMTQTEDWGLFSPQAESHLQSIMGLQTWNSIRALDFLLALPEVDAQRVAVTGASGGGTQTFILCALDDRPAVAVPAVMVSTAMQGGCTCENASLLRVDTGNIDFAALFAPKPLGLTAANDWTREMGTKGFPALKQHYSLMGAPDAVMLKPLLHFDHNYNAVSRAALYSWLNQHLRLGFPEPILEQDYQRLTQDEMTVWNDEHPRPLGGPEFERQLLRWLTAASNEELEKAAESAADFRELAGAGLEVVIGRSLPQAGHVSWRATRHLDRGSYVQSTGVLRNSSYKEELPAVILKPKDANGRTVIWATQTGKAGLFASDTAASSELKPAFRQLLAAGATVVGVDLLYQGEFLTNSFTRTPRVKNPRESAAYTFGYNRPVFAQRVHDLLSVIRYCQEQEAQPIDLAGLDATGPLVAAARAQAGSAIHKTAVQTGGFRFIQVTDLHDPAFLPGGAKYGDLPGLLALAAPGKLWVSGEGSAAPELLQKLYASPSVQANLVTDDSPPAKVIEAAVSWLLAKD